MRMEKVEADTAQYCSALQMESDAILKKTGVMLDLISDPSV